MWETSAQWSQKDPSTNLDLATPGKLLDPSGLLENRFSVHKGALRGCHL